MITSILNLFCTGEAANLSIPTDETPITLHFERLCAFSLDLHVHHGAADLVQKLSDSVHVFVEVDVPQRPRCLTGVFQPPANALVQILLLQTLQHPYKHTHTSSKVVNGLL